MSTWLIITVVGGVGVAWAWFVFTRTDAQMAEMTRAHTTKKAGDDINFCPLVPGVGYQPGVVNADLFVHE